MSEGSGTELPKLVKIWPPIRLQLQLQNIFHSLHDMPARRTNDVSLGTCVTAFLGTYNVIGIGIDASGPDVTPPEMSHHHDSFFAGGEYVFNKTKGGYIFVDQLCVEKLSPASGVTKTYPLVSFHGGAISATVRYIFDSGLTATSFLVKLIGVKPAVRYGSKRQIIAKAGPLIPLNWAMKCISSAFGA